MNISVTARKIISVFLAFAAVIAAAFVILPPAEAEALSSINYTLTYTGERVKLKFDRQKSSDKIYYTTDGSKPSKDSELYTKKITVSSVTTVRAVEYNKKGKKVASVKITLKPRVQDIVFKLDTSYNRPHLFISSATKGAVIYYTIDGSTPTEKSIRYMDWVVYPEGTLITARAFKSGLEPSEANTFINGDTSTLTEDNRVYAEEIASIINRNRTSSGVSYLELDSELCRAADIRAKELVMAYGHSRPDDRDCNTVLDDIGFKYARHTENRKLWISGWVQ